MSYETAPSHPTPGPPPPWPPDPSAPPTPAPDPTLPPGPPPFWAYTPPRPPRPPWRRTRRLLAGLAVVGVLLLAAGVVVAVQTYRDSDTPEASVRSYFAALARGDAATALAAGAVPRGGRALVSKAVLEATLEMAPVSDLRTGAVTRSGDTATVAVRYRVGGPSAQDVDDTIDLRRLDGRWRLARSAVPVQIVLGNASSWAAVPSPTPFAVPTDTELVFPGVAPVLYRSSLLEVAPTSRVVRFAQTDGTLRLAAQVSEQGRTTAVRTVAAALTACVKGGSGVDPFCPQPTPGRADGASLRSVPQSFTGTLPGLDQLQVDVSVGSDATGTLTVDGTVDANGRWQVLNYDNVAQDRSGATSIPFLGSVAVGAPDSLTWQRS